MFFLIDKPIGISSFDVIRILRKSLGIKKMGHAGTLDPLATGCLLIATEKSTKLLSLLDTSEKEYIFTVRFDGRSESLDAGTPIEKVDTSSLIERSNENIRTYILSQTSQIPPKYSALHIDGERAYDKARKGEDFFIHARPIQVRNAAILERGPLSMRIQMTLSSGGYVRSFAPLLGAYCGVDGGYISSLERTSISTEYGELSIRDATPLDFPKEISYSQLFPTIPTTDITEMDYAFLCQGREISITNGDSYEEGRLVFLRYAPLGFLSLCEYKNEVFRIIKNNV